MKSLAIDNILTTLNSDGNIEYTEKKEIVFIGRSATEYKQVIGNDYVSTTITTVIDKETGICLKEYKEIVSSTNGKTERAGTGKEMTVMKLGNDSTISAFLNEQKAKISAN